MRTDFGTQIKINCDNVQTGRYIKVKKFNSTELLQFCEIRVFGKLSLKPSLHIHVWWWLIFFGTLYISSISKKRKVLFEEKYLGRICMHKNEHAAICMIFGSSYCFNGYNWYCWRCPMSQNRGVSQPVPMWRIGVVISISFFVGGVR